MNLKVTKQGGPIVNLDTRIIYQSEQVILTEIDMESKWCDITYVMSANDGFLGFAVGETSRSIHLSKQCMSAEDTEVQITDYSSLEWTIFNITCSRYTIRVTLFRRTK
jgi:hypothetical protein